MKALEAGQPLHGLTAYHQFLLWKEIPNKEPGKKPVKLPIDPMTGEACSAHDRKLWVPHEMALAMAPCWEGSMLAFVFTKEDPFFFLDIDDGWDGAQWSVTATDLYNRFAGCAWEVSHSGKGAHIFGRTTPIEHSAKNGALKLEFYTDKRFVALTGNECVGDCSVDATQVVHQIVPQLFAPKTTQGIVALTDSPDSEWDGPTDDEVLIDKMLKSKSFDAKLNGKACFRDLWECNVEVLARNWPDSLGEQGRAYDASTADAALLQHLAFWTGKHGTRMVRLARRSALKREKWDRKSDPYLERSALSACNKQVQVYQQRRKVEAPTVPTPPEAPDAPVVVPTQQEWGTVLSKNMTRDVAKMAGGVRIYTTTMQLDHFAGCCYILDLNKILTSDGSILERQQFNALYGGYEFMMDAANDKTSKSAWEAFCESRAIDHPKVHSTVFKPNLPPGYIYKQEGQTVVNTYYPAEIESKPGDTTRFLHHLAMLFPDVNDRNIFLSYMAACVQYKGIKFKWCPLVQGVPGNGKTLFTCCLVKALGRRFTHTPKATDIDNKFNKWLERRLFIGVEDIYVPESKQLVIETLKPMITAGIEGIEIQGKGADQYSTDICCNFILNSNHKDAVRKSRDDRRFAIFYNPQQTYEDIVACGMGGSYFPDLYDWLDNGGYAHVTHLLQNMKIEDQYNPTKELNRAPKTSSTEEAISASKGGIEQEIEAAIEEDRVGFCGGWVSSLHLNTLLKNIRADRAIPHKRRCGMMETLGYIRHPGLPDGRSNRRIAIDQGKPRLYVRIDHPSIGFSASAIPTAYEHAQTAGSI